MFSSTILEILEIAGNVLFVAFFIGMCIFIHELGHFLAAKWRGLHIDAFSIGFKKIWGKKINVTGMNETPFYQELKNDIDRSGYHLTAIQRTLFTSESSIVRLFAIIARGVMKIFH